MAGENVITMARISLDIQEFESQNDVVNDATFTMSGIRSGEFAGADGTEYTYTVTCSTVITKKSNVLMMDE